MEHEGDGDTSCNWCTWNNLQKIDKGIGRFRNKRTSKDYPDYNIEESWRYEEALTVLQTPVKSHQLMLV